MKLPVSYFTNFLMLVYFVVLCFCGVMLCKCSPVYVQPCIQEKVIIVKDTIIKYKSPVINKMGESRIK